MQWQACSTQHSSICLQRGTCRLAAGGERIIPIWDAYVPAPQTCPSCRLPLLAWAGPRSARITVCLFMLVFNEVDRHDIPELHFVRSVVVRVSLLWIRIHRRPRLHGQHMLRSFFEKSRRHRPSKRGCMGSTCCVHFLRNLDDTGPLPESGPHGHSQPLLIPL